jgi:intracellular multiplication protein IcmV
MGLFNVVKTVVKPFVDFPTWMGYKQIRESTGSLLQTLKGLFTPSKAETTETYQEALRRLNLTEKDIEVRKKQFTYLLLMWLVIAIAVLIYGFYLTGLGSWHGFISCVAISLIALVQTFKFHFWLFQIKQKRLGCTFRDWLNGSVRGDKV